MVTEIRKSTDRHLPNKLYELIYNPELPEEWSKFSYHENIFLFHGLFLMLNPDFQKEFGKHLLKVIRLESILSPHHKEAEKILPGLTYVHYAMLKPDAGISDRRRSKKVRDAETQLHDLILEIKWPRPFNHRDFFNILMRERRIHFLSLQVPDMAERQCINILFRSEQINKRHPDEMLLKVNLAYPKEMILKVFSANLDIHQQAYFKQNPPKLSYGHVIRKSDNRLQSYDFDNFKKYFQAFVYDKLGYKNEEIAELLYPQNEGNLKRIEKHLSRARKLVDRAWQGNFPC